MGLFGRYQAGLAIPFTLYLAGDKVDEMGTAAPTTASPRAASATSASRARRCSRRWARTTNTRWPCPAGLSLPTGKNDEPAVPGRQERHRPHQGDRRRRVRQGARRRQPRHPAARDLEQLQDRARAPAAVRRRRRLSGRPPRRPDAGGLRAQRPEPVHRASTPTSTRSRPSIAARYTINGMWSVTAGGGRGFGNGIGAPDLRLFAMAAFAPDFRDRDKDGVFDVNDKCPDEPEDRDGFQDQDGCPDPDNDFDRHPRRQGQVPERGRGRRSVRGRRRLPGGRQRQGRHPRHQRRLPERRRGRQGQAAEGRLPVDDRGQPTATASTTRSTSASTSPRTATTSRTTTVVWIRTTTPTASPTTSTTARTTPRIRTASRTRTVAPIRTTTRTASSTRSIAARCRPRR